MIATDTPIREERREMEKNKTGNKGEPKKNNRITRRNYLKVQKRN